MKTVVISVGGSAIVPDKIDITFLKNLKQSVAKLSKNNKLVIVCGGGKVARDYIAATKPFHVPDSLACLAGIRTTKLNATLVSLVLRGNTDMPDSMPELKHELKKRNVVIVGALGFQPNMTSDGDAAQIAHAVNADMFINLTDVDGLFDKNPKTHKDAKFIPEISFETFWGIASKIKFKAGQHFVLDQAGAKIIKQHKIKTIILKGLKNLENSILGRSFKGTIIS
ncbi:MAG TPA: UMP kinase [Candidatus Nanoarchaeia archaeon]|nr:UMP kinase [Candidatus Nanoarchaeia archaeon]